MGTLKQEFIYFNDTVGRVIPNAELYFYDAGTTTPKNTYTSKSLQNANPWPLVADSAGRFPVAWLENSAYRVIVKDDAGVTIEDRDDINAVESELNATSAIYFEDEADLALLIAQNGQSVSPSINDALVTTGSTNATDDGGAQWVVVAAGTGTPGANYINLANGLQAQRINATLETVADSGATAQEAACGNLDSFYIPNYLQEIEDDGSSAQATARGNISAALGEDVQTIAANGDLSGNFEIVKIGDTVTITSPSLTHSSSFNPISSTGLIPSGYRPPSGINFIPNVYAINASVVFEVAVYDDGKIGFDYRDWTGSATNQTATGAFTITYIID